MPTQIKEKLREVMQNLIINVNDETNAFLPCLRSAKKIVNLRLFPEETLTLLNILTKKLTHYITTPEVK